MVTKLTGRGEGIAATSNSASFNVNMDTTGFILWIVVMVVYFVGAKKLWGKTIGGLITDKLLSNKN